MFDTGKTVEIIDRNECQGVDNFPGTYRVHLDQMETLLEKALEKGYTFQGSYNYNVARQVRTAFIFVKQPESEPDKPKRVTKASTPKTGD